MLMILFSFHMATDDTMNDSASNGIKYDILTIIMNIKNEA